MNWFNKLQIGGRLVLGFSIMIGLVGILGFQSYLGGKVVASGVADIAEVRLPGMQALLEADRDLQQLLVAERSMIFANVNSEVFQGLVAEYEENLDQAWTRWNTFKSLSTNLEEQALIPEFEAAFEKWKAVSRRVVDGRIADTREGRREALDLSLGQASESFEIMRGYIDQLTDVTLAEAEKARVMANRRYASNRNLQFSMIAGGLVVGVAFAWGIRRSITGPLARLISGLTRSASQLTTASGQVSAASQFLSEGSSTQAAGIEQTSAALEQMSAATTQNAAGARNADDLMQSTIGVVGQANAEMGRLDASMQEITEASVATQRIVKTIDEIAFQTNLLALNAAVEAARAGSAGAGFAVVAEEVRNLAKRAAEASRNTAQLIKGTVGKVEEGSIAVNCANTAFRTVSENIAEAGRLISGIARASGEQAQGISQVNKAVTEMDQVTQTNAASAEESASAAEEMKSQAGQLAAYVKELQALVGGRQDPPKVEGATAEWGSGPAHLPSRRPAFRPVSHPRRGRSTPSRPIMAPDTVETLGQDDFLDLVLTESNGPISGSP
ncbi:MAG: methyl-accepting chemotaxis protein [Candidatus Krumholzibacteriia bacterium]